MKISRVKTKLSFDDVDGTSSYPRKTMKTNPGTNGIYLTSVDHTINNPIMSLPPDTAHWTNEVSLQIDSGVETARRIFDETQRKNRFCLHVMDGLVDITLQGSQSGSTPFYLSLPFESPKIALISDFACDTTPSCDIFEQPLGARTVMNYYNMGLSNPLDFKYSGNTALVSNYLRLSQYKNEVNSAYVKKQIVDPNDSFRIEFEFEFADGETCGAWNCFGWLGHGDGFALVLSQSMNYIGEGGDWGQGYLNFPGKSVALAIDSYAGVVSGVSDGRKIGLFVNGKMEETCSTPWSTGCTSGRILYTDNLGGKALIKAKRKIRLVYDGIRKNMYVYIDGTTYGSWVQILQAHVDLKSIFECTDHSGNNPCGNVNVGFTASTGRYYISETRIYSFKLERAVTFASKSIILENGKSVGAVHDGVNALYSFTIDAKDACSHDRSISEVEWRVQLRLVNGNKVISIQGCGGSTGVGVCPKKAEGTPPNVKTNNGIYIVRFRTDVEGFYNVELNAPGSAYKHGGGGEC
eukprot:g4931.t1